MDLIEKTQPNQFALLRQRRFAPFFWTQFLGAGNDNMFKFAFIVMVTYQIELSWLRPKMAGLVISALFILPFLLFSATSGQLADKYEKARLMRLVKWIEVAIMLVAAWGFGTDDVIVLLVCVFLMGLHSTLFGPVKYAYLPQHLKERELTGGNGMVEMGTFVSILLGQIAGGLLVAIPNVGRWYVGAVCVAVALLGRAAAQGIPSSPSAYPALTINWNPFTETWRNLMLARENPIVLRSMLGISWMWFFGAVFLAQFPSFAKEVLRGDEQVASLLLVLFSIGVGIGALMCEVLNRRHVEIGLVLVGAIGMSLFSIDLYFASRGLGADHLQTLSEFVARPPHWRVMIDLALLSLSAGIYSVPMYALVQLRSKPGHRARMIAANNVINSFAMIVSAIAAGALLTLGFTIAQLLLFAGIANAIVAIVLCVLVPEYFLRFLAFVMARLVYRLRIRGDEQIAAEGAAVLVCDYPGLRAALLVMSSTARPIAFVVHHRHLDAPITAWLFKLAKAIPNTSTQQNQSVGEQAIVRARQIIDAGGLVCFLAAEGAASTLVEGRTVPVIPIALLNLDPHRWLRPVELLAGIATTPSEATPLPAPRLGTI
jgi:MFS family permease